jgi:hypothetical protein
LVAVWAPPELLSATTGAPSPPATIFDDAPAEPDGESGPDDGKSLPPFGFGVTPSASVVDEDEVDEDTVDGDFALDGDVFDGDFVVDEEGVVVDEESPVDGDSESESAGRAYAMPGVVATAAPTPSATASAPT